MIVDATYNPFTLRGKRVLVTGASSGIGKATAIECSKMGATVIITARSEERLQEAYSELYGEGHSIIVGDLSNTETLDLIAETVPKLDGVVNNAGISKNLLLPFINSNDLHNVFELNVFAPMMLTQKLLKKKKINKFASLVFTSSIGGNCTVAIGRSIYSSSKTALTGFMKNAAVDLGSKGIRSNAVLPGFIETELMAASVLDNETNEAIIKSCPLKRHGKPEEVAHAIIYFLSDASRFVTGTTLVIDGGKTL